VDLYTLLPYGDSGPIAHDENLMKD
jgi:hypothetical protein